MERIDTIQYLRYYCVESSVESKGVCICVGAYVLKCVLSKSQNIVLHGENKVQYALRRRKKKKKKENSEK